MFTGGLLRYLGDLQELLLKSYIVRKRICKFLKVAQVAQPATAMTQSRTLIT